MTTSPSRRACFREQILREPALAQVKDFQKRLPDIKAEIQGIVRTLENEAAAGAMPGLDFEGVQPMVSESAGRISNAMLNPKP